MLLGPALARGSRSLLKIGGTIGIIATTLTTLHLGQLTLTLDLIIKLLITFVYTRSSVSIRSRFQNSNFTQTRHKQAGFSSWEDNQPDVIEETYANKVTEENQSSSSSTHCQQITSIVVGWREDKDLYRKCLQGLTTARRCGPVIAGVDGDTAEDEEMVNVFLSMFPDGIVIRLKEQLSKILDRYMASADLMDVESEQNCTFIMDHMLSFIRGLLEEATFSRSIKDIQALCIIQPHQSKKDILFTALNFASVISDEQNIPYLFSTDSDSVIVPDALGKIIEPLESDASIGGVSGHLRFSHPRPTYLTRMTASHYWFEQEIAKAQGAVFGAAECQPGPCAAFRVSVLKSVLVPWFCQRTFGHRTIVNEDRHLTTRILWAGYSVHYAPGAIVNTDTPNTFNGWVKQQVRWSRGTMIETLWYPWMINQLSPWHVYNILKARGVPLLTFWYTTSYAFGFGGAITKINSMVLVDIFCSIALQVTYLVNISPEQGTPSDVIWLVPSIVWFFLMSPGIVVWSLVTILDDSWGNLPRAMSWGSMDKPESSNAWVGPRVIMRLLKIRHVAFQVFWLGVILIAMVRASLPAGA